MRFKLVRATQDAAFLFLVFPAPALAIDGVLEINQTCAVQTGCFAGDTPGLPVTIASSGSYRLTSNLIVPDVDTDGILISATDVGVDLGGFSIRGPVTCSGSPVVCSPIAGTGSGVEILGFTNFGISIRNGSVVGMGNYGVVLGNQAEVADLTVRWSAGTAVSAGAGSVVSGVAAHQNGAGIFVNSGSTVTHCAVSESGATGISAFLDASIIGNGVRRSGSTGIAVGSGAVVSDNTIRENGAGGILVGSGSNVSGNSTYQNTGTGLSAGSGSHVQGNAVRSNTGFGMVLGTGAAYRENTVTSNTGGSVSGGVNLGDNSCNGSTTCP